MTESEMIRCPESWQLDFQPKLKWDYCHGLELQAMLDVYDAYGDKKIVDYALAYADTMIHNDGSIVTYKLHEYNIDRLNSGNSFSVFMKSLKMRSIRKQLICCVVSLTRIHAMRMVVSGIKRFIPLRCGSMVSTWLLLFTQNMAFRNNQVKDYADVVNQFITVARHTYDPQNGLYRHACDVSRKERWADPEQDNRNIVGDVLWGWYAMAFVDALDFIPKHEAGRDSMLVILNNIATQVKRIQDPKTGLWYQVLDKSGEKGNYLESSCSTMFVYALFKAVRMGYIDQSYLDVALKGYKGILDNFIEVDNDGLVTITKACAVAGLGGKNYRSGDYDYYINETIRDNDPKAVGPFIMASLEYERLQKK